MRCSILVVRLVVILFFFELILFLIDWMVVLGLLGFGIVVWCFIGRLVFVVCFCCGVLVVDDLCDVFCD